MQWKNAKLVKLVVKSILGGNLRLRVSNEMKLSTGTSLKKATGENTNPFYQVEETPAPIVSLKATITTPAMKETKLYDISTQAGRTYTFIAL